MRHLRLHAAPEARCSMSIPRDPTPLAAPVPGPHESAHTRRRRVTAFFESRQRGRGRLRVEPSSCFPSFHDAMFRDPGPSLQPYFIVPRRDQPSRTRPHSINSPQRSLISHAQPSLARPRHKAHDTRACAHTCGQVHQSHISHTAKPRCTLSLLVMPYLDGSTEKKVSAYLARGGSAAGQGVLDASSLDVTPWPGGSQ